MGWLAVLSVSSCGQKKCVDTRNMSLIYGVMLLLSPKEVGELKHDKRGVAMVRKLAAQVVGRCLN